MQLRAKIAKTVVMTTAVLMLAVPAMTVNGNGTATGDCLNAGILTFDNNLLLARGGNGGGGGNGGNGQGGGSGAGDCDGSGNNGEQGGHGHGPGNGSGNNGDGPKDGSGNGAGTGVCINA
jgi:hypothetical protein